MGVHDGALYAGSYDLGAMFRFDGKAWQELPETSGQHLPPWDRAVRVGLTVGGVRNAEAKFDSFTMEPVEGQ